MVAPLVLGNFQIPFAVTRILLGLSLFLGGNFDDLEDQNKGTHIVQTLKALYIMLICQGTLYILACLFESFSYFFRASLALHCGLIDKMGMESIGLYYEHAYETSVQESLLDTKKMTLVIFAVDSVNADVPRDKKLTAVQILNSFLQENEEASNIEVISQVTASTKAVSTLISMLGWTVPEGASPTEEKDVAKDADVRLFTAKVVVHLAPYLRIVGIPGTMQMISSLLDAENNPAREELLEIVEGNGGTNGQEVRNAQTSPQMDGNGGTSVNHDIEMQVRSHAPTSPGLERGNADNHPPMEDSSAQASHDSEGSSRIQKIFLFFKKVGIWICETWKHYMKDIWSIPRDSSKDEDSIPVLGVLILERLAYDVDNCAEISRSTEILPKIIGFISHITDTSTEQQKQIVASSLALVVKLASIKGAIGVTLRKDLSENPLLLSKLAEISEYSGTGPEQWKPTMDIIAKLAMDEKARQEIWGIQVIIAKLLRTFLGRDESPNTANDPSLRKAAGEALAMLAMDSTDNCSAMLDEPGNELTKNLVDVLLLQDPDGEYVYIAAILLQSVCTNLGEKLPHQEPNQDILSAFPAVLEGIMKPDSKGKQLEALIGLASRICKLVPGSITRPEILKRLDDAAFFQKLVDELNANRRPSTEIPNMRRRLVELAISMVRSRPIYAEAFRNYGMMQALSMVEKTPSKVERYRLFSGSVGLFPEGEGDTTLSDLVAEAKGLMIQPAAQAAQ